MNVTDAEEQAIAILWKNEGHDEGVPIPLEDRERLLARVRERAAAIEGEAMRMLASRINEGRRYPRRHMRFVFFVLIAIGIAVLLSYLAFARR